MSTIEKALEFEQTSLRSLSTSDRVKISRQAKTLILELNQIYKKKKDEKISRNERCEATGRKYKFCCGKL